MNFDLISIGDATRDVFISPTESDTLCQLNTKDCFLMFSYGDKIPVKTLDFDVGGNAANNVVGTKRLGISSSIFLTLGDDGIGNEITEKLVKEGVDTSYVFRQKGVESDYYTIIVVGGERTIFGYKNEKNYFLPETLPETKWIYLTSMAENFEGVYQKVVEWVTDKQIRLAFNPGSRQIRAGTEKLLNVLKVSQMLYVNREEAETLTGFSESDGKEKELLQKAGELGPQIVIVTDGGNGAFVYDGKRFLKSGVLPVDAYERTGAGDAFGSGCVSALIKEKSLEEALLWGTVNSASVIGYTGAQKGLLKEDDLPVWLERAKSCNVKVEEF